MANFTFYYNPMSRAMIARWALHEARADYDQVLVPWNDKPAELLAINPMGKVPALVHHHGGHDHVVTEGGAVCHYLALTHPDAGLLPDEHEAASYFRWLFFAAGPIEAAVTTKALGFDTGDDPKKQLMAGWGSYDRVIDTLDKWFSKNDFVCGERFTMADVYVGAQIDWGIEFETVEKRDSFIAYAERLRARDAYVEARSIDNALAAQQREAAPAD